MLTEMVPALPTSPPPRSKHGLPLANVLVVLPSSGACRWPAVRNRSSGALLVVDGQFLVPMVPGCGTPPPSSAGVQKSGGFSAERPPSAPKSTPNRRAVVRREPTLRKLQRPPSSVPCSWTPEPQDHRAACPPSPLQTDTPSSARSPSEGTARPCPIQPSLWAPEPQDHPHRWAKSV